MTEDKPGIERWTPCSCSSAVGMWDRAIIPVTDAIRRRAEPTILRVIKWYEENAPLRNEQRDWRFFNDREGWELDLRVGHLAEVAFSEATGYRWLEGKDPHRVVDVDPDWDVKFRWELGLWVTKKRGKDWVRYAFASGNQDIIAFYGFATGAAVKERGTPGVRFGEDGWWLDVGGLHRFPDGPKLHRAVDGPRVG